MPPLTTGQLLGTLKDKKDADEYHVHHVDYGALRNTSKVEIDHDKIVLSMWSANVTLVRDLISILEEVGDDLSVCCEDMGVLNTCTFVEFNGDRVIIG
jgi:hypothetical protein